MARKMYNCNIKDLAFKPWLYNPLPKKKKTQGKSFVEDREDNTKSLALPTVLIYISRAFFSSTPNQY